MDTLITHDNEEYHYMTKTNTMELEARSPQWLIAKTDLARIERVARKAAGVPDELRRRNEIHANEVAEKRRTSGYPLITARQAEMRGGGSGAEVIYSRCKCSEAEALCEHDPAETPYPHAAIEAVEVVARKAEAAAVEARERLAATEQSWDAADAARAVNARYVHWPHDQIVDPRKRRYRGKPVTDDELADLGIHGLNRAVANGSIIEVPS